MNAPISIQRSDGTSARLEDDALVLRDPVCRRVASKLRKRWSPRLGKAHTTALWGARCLRNMERLHWLCHPLSFRSLHVDSLSLRWRAAGCPARCA